MRFIPYQVLKKSVQHFLFFVHVQSCIYATILKGVKVNATDKIARHIVHTVSQFVFLLFVYFTGLLSKLAQQNFQIIFSKMPGSNHE